MRNITIFGIDFKGTSYAVLAEREDMQSVYYTGWVSRNLLNCNNVVRVKTLNSDIRFNVSNPMFNISSFIDIATYDLPVITGKIFSDVEDQDDLDECVNLLLSISFNGTNCGYGMIPAFNSIEKSKEWVLSHTDATSLDLDICIDKSIEDIEMFPIKDVRSISFVITGLVSPELCNNLQRFIEEYKIVEWCSYNYSVPVMYFLRTGRLDVCRNVGPKSILTREFYEMYGVEEHPVFKYPLFDHVFCFRDSRGRGYIVTNPYLTDSEVVQYMDCLDKESVCYGNYSDLNYKVLGKDRSFYSEKTNMVVFSI